MAKSRRTSGAGPIGPKPDGWFVRAVGDELEAVGIRELVLVGAVLEAEHAEVAGTYCGGHGR
jgi:hypothetical protein